MVEVTISNDPFTVYVDHRQLERKGRMPRATAVADAPAVTSKELRRKAKNLNVRNWEEMDRDQLAEAIAEAEGDGEAAPVRKTRAAKATKAPAKAAAEPAKAASKSARATKAAPAKKTTAKKAPAKAAKAKESSEREGPNPFRPGTNLHLITEALMKGGKRSALVKRLVDKLEYNPRVQDTDSFDREAETDRRLKVVGYILRNQHGFSYEHDGRGPDAFIKATPPE